MSEKEEQVFKEILASKGVHFVKQLGGEFTRKPVSLEALVEAFDGMLEYLA